MNADLNRAAALNALNSRSLNSHNNELFFVDRSVTNASTLLTGIAPSQVVYLDESQDGIEQISQALANRQNVAAVHIISHGNSGLLRLGNADLSSDNLDRYRHNLQSWKNSLTDSADILIYGCDVGAGLQGQAFVNQISQWTGADVAASEDLTGNASLGGDWILEMETGTIDSNILSSIDYQGVLATVSLDNGKLLYESTGGYQNDLNFYLSGSDLVITDKDMNSASSSGTVSLSEILTAQTGITQVNDYTVKVALASITAGIEIKTGSANDTLNFTSAFNSFSSSINFNIDLGDDNDTVIFSQEIDTKGGNFTISGGSGNDNFTFIKNIHTRGGSLNINGNNDSDTISILSNLYTQGGNASFTANTININPGSIISTRKISDSDTDHATALSTGSSGSISLTGRNITIGSSGSLPAAQLLAHVAIDSSSTASTKIGSSYTAGDITLTTSQTQAAATVLDGTETSKAAIDLYTAILKGKDVKLSAQADYAGQFTDTSAVKESGNIVGFLDNFSLVGGGAISVSKATITADAKTQIFASNLTASATAKTNATIQPLFSYVLGAAYGKADSTAKVSIAGLIETSGNVTLSTLTDNTVDVQVNTARWDNSGAASLAAAVAVSELYSDSIAEVTDTAIIKASGNVAVTAKTIDRNRTDATSKTGKDGYAAMAVAVSFEDGQTIAAIDGQVNATGDITVNAAQTNGKIAGILSGGSALIGGSGVSANAGVGNSSSSVIGGLYGSASKAVWDKLSSLMSSKTSKSGERTQKQAPAVQIGAASAYIEDTNTVTARIGGKAENDNTNDNTAANVTSSKGAITIQAIAANRPDVSASSDLDTTKTATDSTSGSTGGSTSGSTGGSSGGKFAGSAALAIGDYTNNVNAYIGNAATVNAYKDLSVTSQALNSYSTEWGVNLIEPWSGPEPWYKKAGTFTSNLLGYLNDNLGLENYVFDSWSQATAKSTSKVGIAGAVTILGLHHTSNAYIDQDAKINQDTAIRSDQQNVIVNAQSINESVHFGGNIQLPGVFWSTRDKSIKAQYPGVGTQSSNAVGGTVLILDYSSDVNAQIEDGVTLYADSLKVNADSKTMNIDVAASGGKAETFGFNGAGTWVYVDNSTTAQIDDGVTMVIGNKLVSDTNGSLVVNAKDNTDVMNIMGGVAVAENIGIGTTIGFNTINRNTRAVIGNLSDSGETDLPTSITSGGNVIVNARNQGNIASFSLASAIAMGSQETTNADGTTKQASKFGLGVSGDVAFNTVTDNTEAYLRGVQVTIANQATTSITANNDSDILAIGGSIAATIGNKGTSKASLGLAGAYGQNTVRQNTNAYLYNSTLKDAQTLTVNARNGSEIYVVTASGAGVANSDVNVGIAGAVTINDISNQTKAFIQLSTVTIAGAITVNATDDSTLHADAGGAALAIALKPSTSAASLSAGVGVAINDVNNTVSAYVDKSTLNAGGNVAITADSIGTIEAFAIGAAASVTSGAVMSSFSLSGAGSGTRNEIENTVLAHVSNNSRINTTGSGKIIISATDDSDITADSGGYALTYNGGNMTSVAGSVGVSVAENDIHNMIAAYVDNSTLTSVGAVNITANSTAEIDALSIGGSAAVSSSWFGSAISLSGAGASANNSIDNTISAQVKNNATIKTTNNAAVNLTATDDSEITADAGGVAIAIAASLAGSSSGSLSIGAAIATNKIGQEEGHIIQALVDNATINGSSQVNLTAQSTATIDGLAFSGAAALGASMGGAGISLAGAGTGIDNTIKATIAAGIQNNGKVTTVETVTITATDDSEIIANAGAASLAIGLSSSGAGVAATVGVAIAENEISNTVKAYVDQGIVTAGDLNLAANSTATIDNFGLAGAVSVAVGSSAGVSAAGTGTGVTNKLTNTIQSYIQNGSTITTRKDSNNEGDLNLSAIDQSTIKSVAVGGSIAVSGSSSAAFSMAIGAVTVDNTIDNTVQAFIGQNATDATIVNVGDDLTLKANSQLTMTENTAVAASLAAGIAPTSASFSGAGARVTTTTSNEIGAFIRNVNTASDSNVKAVDTITLAASDSAKITPTVGSGAVVASVVGASVGVSTTHTTVNNQVQTYVDNAKVSSSNNLDLSATANPDIDALSVATSVAASIGGAGAGAEAIANVKSTVESRIGANSKVKANTINVIADSTDDVAADAYGASAGLVAIGASVADAKTESKTIAQVSGATVSATNLNVKAIGDGHVVADVTSIAGGIVAGNGNKATATSDGTVQAYVGNDSNITLTNDLNIKATSQPKATADADGIGAAVGVQVGLSQAIAKVTPQVDAYVGNNSTITANNLTIAAQQILPVSGDAAHATASAAGGALLGSINASESTASNTGQVSAYVGKNSKLTATNTVSILADADSQQEAMADGYNGGLLALGGNVATAKSDLTTQAYLATGVNINAKDLKIQALGNDQNFAEAIAGGGGLVSGQGARSYTDSLSAAKVRIEDGDATSGNVEINIANAIDIKADQTTDFNSKANSTNAAVVGASGAEAINTVNTEVLVEIGVDTDRTRQNLAIQAHRINIDATQTILKAKLNDQNAEAGSGGAVDLPAVSSKTTIENSTKIIIGDDSALNGFDTTITTQDDILFSAKNSTSATDKSALDSGGLISVAEAKSQIDQRRNEAIVRIQDANLLSNDQITLAAKADVTLNTSANASSYGLSAVPSAHSIAKTNTKNQIQLTGDAYLRSEKDVNLLAGQDADGNANDMQLDARADIWNYTALPLANPGTADAEIIVANTINVDAGAKILSVNDTNLLANEGFVDTLSTKRSQNTYDRMAGSSEMDISIACDNIDSISGVTVNGMIQVSIENQEVLTIDENLNLNRTNAIDGVQVFPINITQQSDGIGAVTLSVENLYTNISSYILQLQELKATYAGNSKAVASYSAEIAYWEQQLAELGSTNQVVYIEVPDIKAKVGDIRVTGDYLKGSGSLNSPGDAKIRITNGSPYYLRVSNLIIPEAEGGYIFLNGVEVTDNASINKRNKTGHTANFSQVITSENSADALIEVINTYDPTFAAQKDQFVALGASTPNAPDLAAIGNIDNLRGTIRLANNDGSVIVSGKLNAETIDIDSGRDFVLNNQGQVLDFNPSSSVNLSSDTITLSNHGLKTGDRVFYSNDGGNSIGGLTNNRSYFAIVINQNTVKLATTQSDANNQSPINLTSAGSGTQHRFSLTDDLGFLHVGGDPRSQLASTARRFELGGSSIGSSSVIPDSTSSSIVASNNVMINARYLNINGLIQSGAPDRSVTLDSTLNTQINNFKTNYDQQKRAGGNPNKYLTLQDDTDVTKIEAKYNAETNRIEVDDVKIAGGYMLLVGHILSTGNGKLQALDGFGKIAIDNKTNYDIAINAIDTGGKGIEGKIQIIDMAKTGADGSPLITTYTRLGNNITISDNSIAGGKTTTQSNTRNASYNPLADQRYTWVTGQASIKETEKTYRKATMWGSDELAKNPGTVVEETSIILDAVPLLEGALVERSNASNLYTYKRQVISTSDSQLVDQDTWTKTSGVWPFETKTYYRRDTYQQGQKTIYTHSYNADSPINIQFIGYDTGSVNITSARDVMLLDSIRNAGGDTSLISSNGNVENLSTIGTVISNRLSLRGNTIDNLRTDVNQLQFTATDNVSITDRDGDVTISGESYSDKGKITLAVEGSLLSAGNGNYDLKGYTLDLTAQTGSIGTPSKVLRVNSGTSTTTSLNTVDGKSGLTLNAAEHIYLQETAGDLYLVKATAGGNVVLNISNGGLVDNNLTESLDSYSQAQLENLWTEMELTRDRSATAIASFKQQAASLYDTYWQYRNLKSTVNAQGQTVYTADAYNSNFAYSYSDTAKAQLLALGYSDSQITAMATQKSAEYQTLHTLLSSGSITLAEDNASLNTVITDVFKDSDFTGKNLTDINTYQPNLIRQNYTVSTAQQTLLRQGSKWTIDQLKNTVAKGVFGAITDTQYTVEDANIEAGGDVTVIATGAIGRTEGSITINNWANVKNWATDLTQEQRLALSSAERDDLTYYDTSGNRIADPNKSNQPIGTIIIRRKQDVDINAGGQINLTAGGQVFLGSEQDINLDQVNAGSEVRIKAAQGIYDVAIANTTNIIGSDLILESGSASIGTRDNAITIDLTDKTYYNNGKLYLLSNTGTWENAQAYAQSLGGNLVTINDAIEEQWLKTTFGTKDGFWVGLTDKVTEGQFVWANGETATYRNWSPGEPSNTLDEDYIAMNFGDNRQWNDWNATTNSMRGIIEISVKEYGGNYYLLNPNATWETAQTAAQALGGNLVTINSTAEEQWLKTNFGTTNSFWIGLTDKVTEGQFVWANGETATYRNWAPGEPSNSNNEDYVSMNFGTNRQWNDASSTTTMRGLVEIQALGASLTARAKENLYIANANGALNVDQIYAGGTASLASIDAIYDATHDTASNIQANEVIFTATAVGTLTDGLELSLNGQSNVQLNTSQAVYLRTLGDLRVDVAGRSSGDLSVVGDDNDNKIALASSNDNLQSSLNIWVDGRGGNDTLIVEPTRSGGTWNSTNRTISGSGLGNISYNNNEKVLITPIARKDTAATMESALVNIAALSNDVDFIATNPISITSVNSTSISTGKTVTLSSGALVTLNADNSFAYNPNGQFEWIGANRTATDSFTYSVTNAAGGIDTATVQVTITGRNDAPVSLNDIAITDEATKVTIAPLKNDSDVDRGDILRIARVNGSLLNPGTTVTLASGAMVTLNNNGTFSYNPNGKFESLGTGKTATDSFTYTINDGNGAVSTATVSLTIYGINDGPIALADSVSINENSSITIAALSNDSDIDLGDSLTITQVNGTNLAAGSSLAIGSNAKVTLNSNGTLTYNPNGKLDYLAAGQSTTDTFTYTISDGQGGTSTATVTLSISGVNDAPIAKADMVTTNEDIATTISVLNNDSDIDNGDVITITQVNGSAISSGSTITLISGAKLTYNSNGTFTYNPNGKFAALGMGETGTDSFTYTISDGKGGTSTAQVSMSIKGGTFYERTDSKNPLRGFDVGYSSTPAFADIDKDGDVDAFVGTADGSINYYRNTNGSFDEVTGAANPFNDFTSGYGEPKFSFADIDQDGDLDAFIGDAKNTISYYQNTNGSFTQITGSTNPFNGVIDYGALGFVDIDNDGDLDAFTGQADGTIKFYRNTNKTFAAVTGTSNPFNGVDVGDRATIAFADVDQDGDADAFIGEADGTINYYRNTNGSFTQVTGTGNLFNGVDVGQNSTIALTDIDQDGDVDAFIGEFNGNINFFENTNIAPIAVNDLVTTNEGASVTINALSNDSDANVADTLSISRVNGNTIAPGSTVTLTSGANLTLNSNGTFSYNPNGKFEYLGVGKTATDSFTYMLRDGKGGTSTATVTLTITGVNDGPIAIGDSATTNEDNSTTITVLSNDSDIDTGDIISITQVNGVAIASGATVTLTSGAKLTLNSNGTFNYNPNGKFSALNQGQQGNDSFTYTINDGKGGTSTATVTLSITGLTFRERTGTANPFNGIDVGDKATPTFADIDKDGDLDAFVGSADGTIRYYRNTNGSFAQVTGTANPFNGVDWGDNSSISFADIDKDGDLDAFIGGTKGSVGYFSNTNGTFTKVTNNYFGNSNDYHLNAPSFADIDNDGDLDAFVTTGSSTTSTTGTVSFYRNTNGSFAQVTGTANPFNNKTVLTGSRYSFADIDKDGDLDMFVGDGKGAISYYRNTNGSFSEQSNSNPFSNISGLSSSNTAITFADIDGDGDLDTIVGQADGTMKYLENK